MKRDPKRDPRKLGVFKNPYIYWWARQDSNLQPDRYERPALTIELQARRWAAGEGTAAGGAASFYSLARDPEMAPRVDAHVGAGPLLHRHAGKRDHLAPSFGFLGDQGAIGLRRHRHRHAAELGQPRLQLR